MGAQGEPGPKGDIGRPGSSGLLGKRGPAVSIFQLEIRNWYKGNFAGIKFMFDSEVNLDKFSEICYKVIWGEEQTNSTLKYASLCLATGYLCKVISMQQLQVLYSTSFFLCLIEKLVLDEDHAVKLAI